ncbi:hypothetical protein [Paenibacillus sp. WC2504]|uniref:hypothetical protein n=1 Tax=Paenibacillus sp. WC2504 TaxID=3461403 RepID=UPI00404539CB
MNDIIEKINGKVDEISSRTIAYGLITVKTNEAREGYQELLKMLEERNLEYTFAEGRKYTKKEMDSSYFFHVNVPFPWEHEPLKNAAYYGTVYETLEVDCECQLQQISELRLDVKKMKKSHLITIYPQLIVTEHAKNIIIQNELTGCEFLPANDYKERELGQVFEMRVINILPLLSERTRLEKVKLKHCSRCIAGAVLRSELIYEKADLKLVLDFNLTTERLNAYDARQLVVSKKVRDVFNENKIKVYGYEPVAFHETC